MTPRKAAAVKAWASKPWFSNTLLVFGLTLVGWSMVSVLLIDMLLRGSAGSAGPGMEIFNSISSVSLADRLGVPYKFSLCVTDSGPWQVADFAKAYLMWGAMVLAMMAPTLFPTFRRNPRRANFIWPYLSVWFLGSFFAVLMQWGLSQSGFISSNMVMQSSFLSAAMLIAVGLFQLSPIKRQQITACQHSDPETNGWQAGINCLTCCGPLMLVMFIFGLMNVVVMAGITLFILAERFAKLSDIFVKASGVLLITLGLLYLL